MNLHIRNLILISIILFCSTAHAEDVVTYSGTNYLGCRSIGDSSKWLNDVNDTSTVKDGYLYAPDGCSSLPQVADKYKKISNGQVVEMTQAEKDAVDLAESQAQLDADNARIDGLSVTPLEAWTAWVKVYNSKVPAQYQVTKQELVNRIKANR